MTCSINSCRKVCPYGAGKAVQVIFYGRDIGLCPKGNVNCDCGSVTSCVFWYRKCPGKERCLYICIYIDIMSFFDNIRKRCSKRRFTLTISLNKWTPFTALWIVLTKDINKRMKGKSNWDIIKKILCTVLYLTTYVINSIEKVSGLALHFEQGLNGPLSGKA